METPDNIETQNNATPPLLGNDAPPTKRGRGRPPKNQTQSAQEKIDATKAQKAPPQSKKKKGEFVEPDMLKLSRQLMGVHAVAARITGLPFVAISDAESLMLAESVTAMAREYDLVVSGKAAATFQLIGALAVIYGPRAVMFKAAKMQAQQKAEMMAKAQNADDVSVNSAG